MHEINNWQLALGAATAVLLGVLVGAIMQEMRDQRELVFRPLSVPSQRNSVRFEAIENGVLRGRVAGTTLTLSVGDELVAVLPDGDFATDITPILPQLQTVPHPNGAQFVASRQGKYYWALDSLGAAQIAWKNRRFFDDAVGAEAAGFVRGRR